MPKITVVIPTYNRKTFIATAIESVLSQTLESFNLIVVDDGSTDGSDRIVRSYTDERITYVARENGGVSAARNQGIRLAQSEWIAFLDSDDYWLPHKLKNQLLFHSNNPDIKISQTQEVWIRHGKRVNQMKKHQKFGGMIYEKCLPLCLITPSSVMLHRTVFENVGLFDETLPACEDYDLWLRIAYTYPVGLINEELIVKQGGHQDQLSRSIPSLDKYRIQAMQKILASNLLNREQMQATIHELKKKCRVYGNGCIKHGKEKEGRAFLDSIKELDRL